LDYIPIEKSNPKKMAYGQSFLDDEIISIVGIAIPPEWTVNLLSMGKEPWKFKYLDDQLNTYRQQCQADQQKQIMLKIAGKSPGRSSEGKRKNKERNTHNNNSVRNGGRHNNFGRGGCGRGRGGGRGNNHDQKYHLKTLPVTNVTKNDTIPQTARHPRKMEMNTQTWRQKRISKIFFNPHLKRCLRKRKIRKMKKTPPI
jgi:hypothetical protein